MNLILPPPLIDYKPELVNSWPFYMQPKLNGISAVFHYDYFYTKTGKVWSKNIVSSLIKELQNLNAAKIGLYIFGEFYVHGWSLQKIQSAIAVNRSSDNHLTPLIEFHIYDCWHDVVPKWNFWSRYSALISDWTLLGHRSIGELKQCRIVDAQIIKAAIFSKAQEIHYYNKYLSAGYEGAIYKFLNSNPGLKRKNFKDAEFECIDLKTGTGKNHQRLGSFVLKTAEGETFSVGSGLTDKQRIQWFNREYMVGKQITIKYLNLSDDGIPLNPTFVSVRDYE